MKILFSITKANFGGAQKYVYDLACAAQEAGHSPVVVYGVPGKLSELLQERGIRIVQLPSLKRDLKLSGEFSSFFSLLNVIKEERPDILHVNSSKGGLALLAGRMLGVKKILFTAHGWAFNEDRSTLQKTLFRCIYVLTVFLSHKTICVSEAVRNDISFFLIKNRLIVVRNGIDTVSYLGRDLARQRLRSETSGVWVGMTAELHKTKRIEDALRALAMLRDEFPTLSLTVMGEGEERAHLEELVASLNLSGRVFFPGFVSEAPTYLHAFDIFLMPSRTEALGYAAIEAGFAGLPVIASNVGGLREVIEHEKTGLLVPPQNPEALADALRALLNNPEHAKQYGTALKEHVEKEFSKERMVRETFALYAL